MTITIDLQLIQQLLALVVNFVVGFSASVTILLALDEDTRLKEWRTKIHLTLTCIFLVLTAWVTIGNTTLNIVAGAAGVISFLAISGELADLWRGLGDWCKGRLSRLFPDARP